MPLSDESTIENTPRKKDLAGKARHILLPPVALEMVSHVLTNGAEKHGDRQYKDGGGMDPDEVIDASMRHLNHYRMGASVDKEGYNNLAAAASNLLIALDLIYA